MDVPKGFPQLVNNVPQIIKRKSLIIFHESKNVKNVPYRPPQYEILVKKQWAAVTRFDTYHHAVHRDLIDTDGTVTKKWFLHINFDEGLNFAYDDIENNWERYREWYLSKVRG